MVPKPKATSLSCPKKHEYYSGGLLDGQPHGHGRLVVCCAGMPYQVDPDVEFYNGSFLNGKFHGLGTLSLSNGMKYVGNFSNGVRNGEGSIYHKGNVEVCIWSNGEVIERL